MTAIYPTRIIPRIEAKLSPVVVKFNRVTRRPPLRRGLGLIVLHYTGVNRRYALETEFEQVAARIRGIERWKPGEYNYVIDQVGRVWELAGEYEGAHTKGYNDRGYGVLFLNGVGEPCNDRQVWAYQWLRGCLQWVGAVNLTPFEVPHQWLAGSACPGEIMARLPDLTSAS